MNKTDWVKKCKFWKNKWPLFNNSFIDDKNGINLYYFIEVLNKYMSSVHTIVCDAGSAIYVPCQNLKIKHGQKFILSGAQADMGFALPASIGVSLSNKKNIILVITGDGSFNTNIQEMATIINLNLPIIVFVWNNGGYLSIRNTQKKFYEGRIYGTDEQTGLWFPKLKKVAKTYNFKYVKIKNNKDLNKKISQILKTRKPLLCEIICKKDQEIIPNLMLKQDSKTGKYIQCSLDDMYPFLSQEEHNNEMIN